ncbi:MAG: GNAT family N-acetyltransferase [Thermoplasmatales archaeon]|nr:GNAT family N-acetyltransferase [Thermoplasmatales archaeon]
MKDKTNSYFIRSLKEKDVKDLFHLLIDLDDRAKKKFHPHSFDYDTIKDICKSKKDHYFIMIIDDKIIGYSFLRLFEYKVPSFGIVIRRKYTAKGNGTILTRWTIDKAKELGYDNVILKTYKDNIASQKIYKKIGFKIVGETEDKKQYKMKLDL